MFYLEILLVSIIVAVACALPGVFLILRRMALISDAISHSVLLGIVLAFLATRNLASPVLLIAAALTGVVMVGLVELLHRTGLVREDAAIGLVFPLLFGLGVILVHSLPKGVHLDECILFGALESMPLSRFQVQVGGADYDLGPKSLYVMGGILFVNLAFIGLFYKELKLATFDAGLAATLGFAPGILHYSLMGLVSLTAVGAFDAVGSILVVALMIAPPAAAYLLTERLSRMLLISAAIGAASAVTGYGLALHLKTNTAGSIAAMTGVFFGATFLLAPERGLIALARRRTRQRWEFAQTMLAIHLFNHEGLPEADRESRIEHLHEHLRWESSFSARVVRMAEDQGLILRQEGRLLLTPHGHQVARAALMA